ncbi:hypothetical protein BH11ACT8_BH11ACT8_25040 [soil metagenome]
MAHPRRTRRTPLASLVVLGLLLALVSGCGGADNGSDGPTDATSTAATTTPAGPTGATTSGTTEERFCAAFRDFAAANSQHLGTADQQTTEAVIRAGILLANLPSPDGLTPGGRASLITLIDGVIGSLVAPADLPVVEGKPDEAQFSAFLDKACPA